MLYDVILITTLHDVKMTYCKDRYMEYNPYFIDNGPKTAWWPKNKVHILCCGEIENLGGGLAARLAWNLFISVFTAYKIMYPGPLITPNYFIE